MIKNIVQISEKINERELSLFCANDTPTVDIKEFAYFLIKLAGNIEDQVRAQEEKSKDEVEDEGKEQAQAESTEAS